MTITRWLAHFTKLIVFKNKIYKIRKRRLITRASPNLKIFLIKIFILRIIDYNYKNVYLNTNPFEFCKNESHV